MRGSQSTGPPVTRASRRRLHVRQLIGWLAREEARLTRGRFGRAVRTARDAAAADPGSASSPAARAYGGGGGGGSCHVQTKSRSTSRPRPDHVQVQADSPPVFPSCLPAACRLLSAHKPPSLTAEFGFNEHHQKEVVSYMRFARSKRVLRLKTIDTCFEELKDSRLVEETFTVDEVREMLEGLQAVVGGEVETELINTAHTNVLLLRQLFSQADKFYLRLQTDISELENRELLEQVAEFEKTDFKTTNKESSKPKLAPLNEGGGSELLNKEITRLQEENEKLRSRLRNLESQAMNVLDEKTRAERALKDLQKVRGDQQGATREQDLSSLESTVAALKEDYERSLNVNAASQKDLQQNLVSAKHELLRVQEQLAMAEKELDRKFQQTAAYRNMKEMLTKKNEQIKEIRKRLQRGTGTLIDVVRWVENDPKTQAMDCQEDNQAAMDNQSSFFPTANMENDSGSGYLDEEDYDLSFGMCFKGWVRDFQRRYEPPLFLLIFVLGTAGNLLVILLYSVIRRRLKTMTDVYLLNLAVADLLFLATLPFWAVNATRGWVFGPHAAAFCKGVVAIYKLNFFSSMMLLTCISVDRYLAIVMVTWVHNLRRETRMLYSRAASLAVWLLASLLALPEVPFAQVRESSAGLPSCDLMSRTETWTKLLVLSLQVCVGFVLPLVVMTTCYSFVLRALLRARSFHKHKALRVVLAVVVVFVASQLPYNGHLMLQALQVANSSSSITDCGAATRSDVAGQVVKSLAYTRACVNPFLYAFVGVRFRRDLLRVLTACAGRLRGGAGGDKMASGPKRPSVMSDTETTAALSL
ncbi:unnamed protein product [Merluccius merluccius]